MSANELSALLWKERELLELLQFKLEEEQLLLVSGKSRWIGMATREVESVLDKVHAASLARSVEAASVAAAWGLADDAPLADIAAQAPQGPWTDILGAHLTALRETTSEIAALREANEQYLRAAQRSTQETLATLDDERPGYDRTGAGTAARDGARIIDTSL
ncbi:flagellar protein FlgN [Arthrobacter sp. JSM 101049]|uniref:flagellar protein FlgN n=1 Tax=Arthrobacter sp. JSM 101049 TaxID=929097 RepID=UPI003565010C